jgi:hypothetical protein
MPLKENPLAEQKMRREGRAKIIYTKYSKPVYSKMLNHGLNPGLFLSLFKFFG